MDSTLMVYLEPGRDNTHVLVVAWLKRHGVGAESMAAPETGDYALQLAAIASTEAADLIVAGACGHSRLPERALGGVTYDLLLRSRIPPVLSH
ncbi:MAG: universal stress protein [Proteobacteria bacterium]|nr:universal stress protein [Pseudomonadota bacterium]